MTPPFNVPTLNGNAIPNPAAPPTPYFGAQAAPVGQLIGGGLSALGAQMKATADKAKLVGDRVAARNAVTELRMGVADIFDGADGLTKKSGNDLFTSAQDSQKVLQERHNELRAALTPDQQVYYDDDVVPVMLGATRDFSSVLDTGARAYRAESDASWHTALRNAASAGAPRQIGLKPSITATTHGHGKQPMDLVDPQGALDLADIDKHADERVDEAQGDFNTDPADAKRILKEEGHAEYHAIRLRSLLAAGKYDVAKAYLDHYSGDIKDAKLNADLTSTVEGAYRDSEVQREASDIFGRFADMDGSWSEKQTAMLAETEDKDVHKVLRSAVEIGREDERKASADLISGAKDAVDSGRDIRDVRAKLYATGASDEDVGKVVDYQRDRAAGKFWPTDMDLYNTLSLQMIHDPLVFLRQNIDDYVMEKRMNEGDAKFWKGEQLALQEAQAKGNSALADDILTPAGVLEQRANDLWPRNSTKQGEFKYKVNAARKAAAQASGKQLGVDETIKLMDTLTAEVAFDPKATFFKNEERVVDEIPAESLAAIIDSLIFRGAEVTAENIRDVWLADHVND